MRAEFAAPWAMLPLCFLLTATVAPANGLSASPTPSSSNEFCPVRPTEPGLEEHEIEYAGQRIRFCCEPCIQAFKKNPKAYLKNVPQFEVNPVVLEDEPDSTTSLLAEVSSEEARQHHLFFASLVLGLLVVAWLVRGLLRRAGVRSTVRPGLLLVGACLLTASVAALYGRVERLNQEVHRQQLKDLLHFATYHDFGEQPIPAKPPAPKRLSATFYRGNDERSPRLFNGGHYRTCAFQLALCDEAGREVAYGDDVAGRRLGVRFNIERAPYTPDFFWTPDRMEKFFLTRRCDPFMGSETPITDRVDLRVQQEMQQWTAWFPLADTGRDNSITPVHACCCDAHWAGIVYVCEAFATPQRMYGARIHYAIQYDVRVKEGRVDRESDVWMGALYRTRKVLQWRLPLEQWFSHEPIPELPKPSVRDAKLLGISDYTKHAAPGGDGSTSAR